MSALKPILLCCRQRSGSHALCSVLEKNGLPALFEPFYFRPSSYGHLFYDYVQRHNISAFDLIGNPNAVLDKYISYLGGFCGAERFLIDVKYNQMHLFDGKARLPRQVPGVLRYFKDNRYLVVHLIRRNLFSQYISTVLLGQTRLGVIKSYEDQPTPEPFVIDLEKSRLNMQQIQASVEQLRQWNRHNRNYCEVFFEDIFEDGKIASKARSHLGEIFDIELKEYVPKYVKFQYDYRKLILNLDQLIAYYQKSSFRQMVLDIVG